MWPRAPRAGAGATTRSGGPPVVAAWLPLLLAALGLLATSCTALNAAPRLVFNRTCRYAARNVSRELFFNGAYNGLEFLFPLETSHAALRYAKPWQACSALPGEEASANAMARGDKLPCSYATNAWGNIDYQEEHACDILLKTNCYCFALDRFLGSYCEPGLGGTGKPFEMPVLNCGAPVAGVLADGGRQVSREAVYASLAGNASGSSFIALAVKPAGKDDGDFHFWRLERDGTWAYKAGDTLSRNTLRSGKKLLDVEAPSARGDYTEFCGYFQVWPATHKLRGNDFWYSSVPSRYAGWAGNGFATSVTTLPAMSEGWRAAYKDYFWDAGWEDLQPALTPEQKESARLPARPACPHWHSAQPASQC